jgi:hypothetical protein
VVTAASPGVIFTPISSPNNNYDCSGSVLKLSQTYQTSAFTASQSGNTITVSGLTSGSVALDSQLIGFPNTPSIIYQAGGTPWGNGTYHTNTLSQTVANTSVTQKTWTSGQIVSYQPGSASGYLTPQYYYAEISLKLPSAVPTGVCPWWTFWFISPVLATSYVEKDAWEMCLQTNSLTAGSSNEHHYPGTSLPSGEITVAAQNQKLYSTFANYDNTYHTYGFLATPTKDCYYTDHVQNYCLPIYGNEERLRMMVIVKMANYFSMASAATDGSANYSIYVNRVSVWNCPSTKPLCQ